MAENKKSHSALVVDDEPDIRELLQLTLLRMGVEAKCAENITRAKELLNSDCRFDLCLTDMRLPDGNGIDLVRYIQSNCPRTPVAVITAHGNMSAAIEALKAGAFDFVNKPVELQQLRELVSTALRLNEPASEQPRQGSASKLLGSSVTMHTIRDTIEKLARSQAPVYVSGESGTGKELVARLIHDHGPRAQGPFIPVNCGAIPAELMESELFGHKKGSFTGANADKDGLFQAANGGTLFLDEVADLPLLMQVKLLRAIQEKAVRPIGDSLERHIDVRILSATHKDLVKLVQEGKFREDLYYRLNVIELKVPSLRDRPEDIPELVNHILGKLSAEMGLSRLSLTEEALLSLKAYPFPGNVRELENILERAITLCEGNVITPGDLRLPASTAPEPQPELSRSIPSQRAEGAAADPAVTEIGLENYLAELEKKAILAALEHTDHNKTAAAKLLGISFRALRYRLKKLELE